MSNENPSSPRVRNYTVLDASAEDMNDKVEIEVQSRGTSDRHRYVVYIHVNGITLCRVICHTLEGRIVRGLTVRRTNG